MHEVQNQEVTFSTSLHSESIDPDQGEAAHHDTHAIPPRFVQQAYVHYNRIKASELESDENVIDFGRGLTIPQQRVMKSVSTIPGSTIQNACLNFDTTMSLSDVTFQDLNVYEHVEFPGLQITPGILPPAIQFKFVSHILHQDLADPKHKTNLEADYDIDYPLPSDHAQPERPPSFFTYAPTESHSKPKSSESHPSLNMVQFLSKKLRWLTIGEQYDWPTRSYKRDGPTTFPSDLADLVSGLFPHIRSESGVCLLYGSRDFMPVHRDVSEQCEQALASFSFGCDGIFLVARGEEEIDDPEERKRRIVAIRVRSGDCVHMSGETRWAWHAMPRTISGTCPDFLAKWPVGTPGATAKETKAYEKWKGFMGSKRLNVSCRQVWDG